MLTCNNTFIVVSACVIINAKLHTSAWVAGITAGAQINQSNKYKVVEGAIGFAPEHKDSVIKEKLKLGKFLFSTRQDGNIVVEKDINTYHLFEPEKGLFSAKTEQFE